jgi:type I restriction enzyme R subunit
VAKAFFGLAKEGLTDKFQDETILKSISADIALAADEIIMKQIVVDWQIKIDVPKRMFHLIGDYLIDEVRDKYHLQMTFEEIDSIAEQIVDVAKIRYKK